MKKIWLIAISILLVLCTLVGCGGAKGEDIIAKDDVENKEAVRFFLNVCNATDSVDIETASGVKQTVNKKDVKTSGNAALILNHISQVDVSDRWTATYDCNKLLPSAEVTITSKDKDNKLLSINWHFGSQIYTVRNNSCDSITTSPSGKTTLNDNKGNFRLTFTDSSITAKPSTDKNNVTQHSFGNRTEFTFSGSVDGDVTLTVTDDNKMIITSESDISDFTVECFNMSSENMEDKQLKAEGKGKSFTVSLDKDGKPVLAAGK